MMYQNVTSAIFCARPNRFVAQVELNGHMETVHVKNTGRCKELLLPGAKVMLEKFPSPNRKTAYDLISVQRDGQWINMDSQAPNKVAMEYLPTLYPDAATIRPEVCHGDSRLDFYLERKFGRSVFVEVKGVTLLIEEGAFFPDAPTERGVKHLHTLTNLVQAGYDACALFIIQMKRANFFSPNEDTQPAFGEALRAAQSAGVRLNAVDCIVTEDSMVADRPVPIRL